MLLRIKKATNGFKCTLASIPDRSGCRIDREASVVEDTTCPTSASEGEPKSSRHVGESKKELENMYEKRPMSIDDLKLVPLAPLELDYIQRHSTLSLSGRRRPDA